MGIAQDVKDLCDEGFDELQDIKGFVSDFNKEEDEFTMSMEPSVGKSVVVTGAFGVKNKSGLFSVKKPGKKEIEFLKKGMKNIADMLGIKIEFQKSKGKPGSIEADKVRARLKGN